ncbi:MAG: putative mycofactocin biosynthesis glycosyltransferase MftF [Chloroflexi bacterium]|nr:putative mycofactocin biosynthesis glycosyltransferase MftF [Chloroflexota bacterium]
MLFSIIIPTLNAPFLGKTLTSLQEQTLGPKAFEVIVVGLDEAGIVQEFKDIRFLSNGEPLSPARARNWGSEAAQGEILAFLDADCTASPAWLSTLVERFQDPKVTVVGGGVEIPPANYWTLADNLSMFHAYLAEHPPGTRPMLPSLNLAIRKSTFEAVGGFDERYPRPAGEDADLSLRLRRSGHTLYFEPCAKVTHHPPRHTLSALLRHAFYQGKYSIKVDPRYPEEGLPPLIRSRLGVLFTSPVLAAGATHRIFRHTFLKKYWPTAPAIWLAKLAWCGGAAWRPKRFS